MGEERWSRRYVIGPDPSETARRFAIRQALVLSSVLLDDTSAGGSHMMGISVISES